VRKGQTHSVEAKKKMADASRGNTNRRGSICSVESKRKMSVAKIGTIPWNKGKEGVQVAWNKGIQHSEETRRKMSVAHKGTLLSEEHKRKISESGKGRALSDEAKKNISKSLKGKSFTEEHLKNWLATHKWYSPSEETRKKLSKTLTKLWQDPEFAKMMFAAQGHLPNKPEMFLESFLNDLYPGEWKYVGDGQIFIAGKCPDFINVNGQKKIIELFGDYWHEGQDPQDRIDIFKPFGYDTLVIWEKELNQVKDLKEKIFNFTEQQT